MINKDYLIQGGFAASAEKPLITKNEVYAIQRGFTAPEVYAIQRGFTAPEVKPPTIDLGCFSGRRSPH
jgi:hypothetical protein